MGLFRLLLALAVVVDHSDTFLKSHTLPGAFAVETFFVISRFYMALILDRKYRFSGGTAAFYQQRYLRLYPMYAVAVLTTLAVCGVYTLLLNRPMGRLVAWMEHGSQLDPLSLFFLLASQATLIGIDVVVNCGLAGSPMSLHLSPFWQSESFPSLRFIVVPASWSLSVEILFYLFAPLLVRRRVWVLGVLVGASLSLRQISGILVGPLKFPASLGFFLMGALAFRLLPLARTWVAGRNWLRWITAGGVLLGIFAYKAIPLPDAVRYPLFIGFISLAIPILFAATERARFDRTIGEISYPLYLLHQITLFGAEPILRRLPGVTHDLGVLLITVAAAGAAYFAIDRPLEQWRARRFDRIRGVSPAV